MTSLLDLILLPPRLAARALDDLHRVADAVSSMGRLAEKAPDAIEPVSGWMNDTATTLRSIRDQAVGVRTAIEPMTEDVRILRDEFSRANDEIARLREAFGPELESLRTSADGLHQELHQTRELIAALQQDADQLGQQVIAEMGSLLEALRALVQEADEISEVVEPLQAATERVGRVAARLPGRGREG